MTPDEIIEVMQGFKSGRGWQFLSTASEWKTPILSSLDSMLHALYSGQTIRLAPVVVISAADWEAEQKRVAALEKDAARYRFLQAASWHIETVSAPNKPDAEWSVSFYSKYGATLNENDPDRAIDAAIEKGA
jgi:hypothetical protein